MTKASSKTKSKNLIKLSAKKKTCAENLKVISRRKCEIQIKGKLNVTSQERKEEVLAFEQSNKEQQRTIINY